MPRIRYRSNKCIVIFIKGRAVHQSADTAHLHYLVIHLFSDNVNYVCEHRPDCLYVLRLTTTKPCVQLSIEPRILLYLKTQPSINESRTPPIAFNLHIDPYAAVGLLTIPGDVYLESNCCLDSNCYWKTVSSCLFINNGLYEM